MSLEVAVTEAEELIGNGDEALALHQAGSDTVMITMSKALDAPPASRVSAGT